MSMEDDGYHGPVSILSQPSQDEVEIDYAEVKEAIRGIPGGEEIVKLINLGGAFKAEEKISSTTSLVFFTDLVPGYGEGSLLEGRTPPRLVVDFRSEDVRGNNKRAWDAARGGDVLFFTQYIDLILVGREYHDPIGYALVSFLASKKFGEWEGWMEKVGDGRRNISVNVHPISDEWGPITDLITKTFKSSRKIVNADDGTGSLSDEVANLGDDAPGAPVSTTDVHVSVKVCLDSVEQVVHNFAPYSKSFEAFKAEYADLTNTNYIPADQLANVTSEGMWADSYKRFYVQKTDTGFYVTLCLQNLVGQNKRAWATLTEGNALDFLTLNGVVVLKSEETVPLQQVLLNEFCVKGTVAKEKRSVRYPMPMASLSPMAASEANSVKKYLKDKKITDRSFK
ncbi:MAG: hypothetical protein H0T78_05640 [Longispora sp.]|nr:hypothetical protein [Longispora sp. (in: high G+C Gram-positive bacteria)]